MIPWTLSTFVPTSQIKEHCPKSKILLVGTKLDLWNNADYANRAISQERIEEVVRDISKCAVSVQCEGLAAPQRVPNGVWGSMLVCVLLHMTSLMLPLQMQSCIVSLHMTSLMLPLQMHCVTSHDVTNVTHTDALCHFT